MSTVAVLDQVDLIAEDIGRVRRLVPAELAYIAYLLERIAGHVEAFDAVLQPTAAEMYRANLRLSGDEELSVREALADVDVRVRRLRVLLGSDER
jgi:hypothetical protein